MAGPRPDVQGLPWGPRFRAVALGLDSTARGCGLLPQATENKPPRVHEGRGRTAFPQLPSQPRLGRARGARRPARPGLRGHGLPVGGAPRRDPGRTRGAGQAGPGPPSLPPGRAELRSSSGATPRPLGRRRPPPAAPGVLAAPRRRVGARSPAALCARPRACGCRGDAGSRARGAGERER